MLDVYPIGHRRAERQRSGWGDAASWVRTRGTWPHISRVQLRVESEQQLLHGARAVHACPRTVHHLQCGRRAGAPLRAGCLGGSEQRFGGGAICGDCTAAAVAQYVRSHIDRRRFAIDRRKTVVTAATTQRGTRDRRRGVGAEATVTRSAVLPTSRMNRRAVCVAAMLLFALAMPAESQIAADALVAVGTPLRLTPVRGPYQVASFESQSAEGLVVRTRCEGGCERISTTAWRDLRQVDARVRVPGSMKRAVIGGLIGGVTTSLALFAVAAASSCDSDQGSCNSLGVVVAAPFAIGAGTALGTTIGWTSSRYRWESVWVAPATH